MNAQNTTLVHATNPDAVARELTLSTQGKEVKIRVPAGVTLVFEFADPGDFVLKGDGLSFAVAAITSGEGGGGADISNCNTPIAMAFDPQTHSGGISSAPFIRK